MQGILVGVTEWQNILCQCVKKLTYADLFQELLNAQKINEFPVHVEARNLCSYYL